MRGRVAIYELISLIRLTLHSWEKMKGSRLKQTILLLEERIECQKTDQSIGQKQNSLIWEDFRRSGSCPDWMTAARDPERICAALPQAIPEFRSGELILHECDSSNVRYKGENWQGFYELTVSKPGESSTGTIDLGRCSLCSGRPCRTSASGGKCSGESRIGMLLFRLLTLNCGLRNPKSVLSALDMLTDPEQSRDYLMSRIRAGSQLIKTCKSRPPHPKSSVISQAAAARLSIIWITLRRRTIINAGQNWWLPRRIAKKKGKMLMKVCGPFGILLCPPALL